MSPVAMKPGGTKLVPPTNVVALGDERDEAQAFACVVVDFDAAVLARAAKRTKEAARGWKEGRSLPSTWSMLNMARTMKPVRDYMLAKLGAGPAIQFNSPQGMDALVQAVHLLANTPGPEGEAIRALLSGKPHAPDA